MRWIGRFFFEDDLKKFAGWGGHRLAISFAQKVWNLTFCASVQTHVRAFDVCTSRTHLNYKLQTCSFGCAFGCAMLFVMVLLFGHTFLLFHTKLVIIKGGDPLCQSTKNVIYFVWNVEAMNALWTHAGRLLEHKQTTRNDPESITKMQFQI